MEAAEAERAALQELQKDYDDFKERADQDDLTADDAKDIETDQQELHKRMDDIQAGRVENAVENVENTTEVAARLDEAPTIERLSLT